jgi:DNA (cytosine-5)-methyltransferase 1
MGVPRQPTAIDLYAGIGGWGLGLEFSGVRLLDSYEWWEDAALTHHANLRSNVSIVDIRSLTRAQLPKRVDIVVGSPPCTQFSYSNRGGSGDIADGLRDVQKFLEVVEELRPRAWAMENVPRVAQILPRELDCGSLRRFRDLVSVIEVVNAADWGVPQARKRMIAGNFDFELMESYKSLWPSRTLGDVVNGLREHPGVDPIYGWQVPKLTDNVPEEPLDSEEERLNRESKTYHRVYNKMSFPDRIDRPARTVTALCTRVSRESIVIADGDAGFRRLTVRERGCLQSFPASYQFVGKLYNDRIKMVGNAIPPLLAFNIVQALLETPPEKVALPKKAPALAEPIPSVQPTRPTRKFSAKRRFAAAIPGLRFGSGMRFELKNIQDGEDKTTWVTHFFHGPSKAFAQSSLEEKLVQHLTGEPLSTWAKEVSKAVDERMAKLPSDPHDLQCVWTRNADGDGPYEVVDALGELSDWALAELNDLDVEHQELNRMLLRFFGMPDTREVERSMRKVLNSAPSVLAGLAVCTAFNATSRLAHGSNANR